MCDWLKASLNTLFSFVCCSGIWLGRVLALAIVAEIEEKNNASVPKPVLLRIFIGESTVPASPLYEAIDLKRVVGLAGCNRAGANGFGKSVICTLQKSFGCQLFPIVIEIVDSRG